MAEPHSRKKLDLTGQRFGKLTVLAPAENVGDRTAWLCRCDCGQETVAITKYLRNGRGTSCGCDKENLGKPLYAMGQASLTYIGGTCVEMIRAKTIRKNNTSGVPGVEWWAQKQRWRATIGFKGKRYYLGSFSRFEDAVKARKEAEARFHDTFIQEYDQKAQQSEKQYEYARRPASHVGTADINFSGE